MSFDATVQPYHVLNEREQEEFSPKQVKARRAIMEQFTQKLTQVVRAETGRPIIGELETGECVSHIHIDLVNFLDHLKEQGCSYEDTELDLIFKDEQQTRFNQLIRIPQAGVYIPHYFFFPIWVKIGKLRNPIWVGSAPRLMEEIGLLTDSLGMDPRLVDSMPKFMMATREQVEDYETELRGDLFFAQMCYNILRRLATESIESQFPILINFETLQ